MWQALAGIANTALNIWQKKDAADYAKKNYKHRLHQTKKLAAEQLAVTYNSISQRSLEVATQYKRQEFALRSEQRRDEGQITAQAAQLGATGNRATLAQKQTTAIPAERQMSALFSDAKREQDALIRNAEAQERETINRLITNQPDMPAEANFNVGEAVIGGVTSLVDIYKDYKGRQKDKDDVVKSGVVTQV